MNNYSFRTKLLGGFGILLVLLVGVGLTGVYCLYLTDHYSAKENAQKDIKVDAETLQALIYQSRLNIYRGMYYKNVREKSEAEKDTLRTYRDFMVVSMQDFKKEINDIVTNLISKLDPSNPQNAEEINSCREIVKLYGIYNEKTTSWVDLQDKINDFMADEATVTDAMKESITRIHDRVLQNIKNEEQTFEVNGKSEPFTHTRFTGHLEAVGNIMEKIEFCRRLSREQATITDFKTFQVFSEKQKDIIKETKEFLTSRLSDFRTAENVEEAKKFLEYYDTWEKDSISTTDMISQQQKLFDEFVGIATQIVDITEAFIDHADIATAEMSKALETTVSLASQIIYGTIIGAVLIGIVMGMLLTKNISSGINRAVMCMKLIGEEGNISIDIPKDDMARGDEIGALAKAFHGTILAFRAVESLARQLASGNWRSEVKIRSNKDMMNVNLAAMLDQINDVLSEIQGNVTQVSTGATEVASAAQNLSNGAQESAASLEQISASMQEISSQTQGNATNASEARNLAGIAAKAAVDGQGAMKEMITAMDRITNNSHEIQRVIKVIDDIAFQTNLLALNAAVEAARAGVHGKGFAVVAEEVRNLAARSSKAAQETTDLISKSSAEIQNGDAVAKQTAEALNAIVEQIEKTSEIISGIAVASNEQAEGVKQVTLGLQQIDTVTQQNSAAAEESASASNEMSSMAKNLLELVDRFQLRQGAIKKQGKGATSYQDEHFSEQQYEYAETA